MHSRAQIGRPEQTGQDTAEDVAESVRRIDGLDRLAQWRRPVRQQPGEHGVLAGGQDVPHVGDIALSEGRSAGLLMQDEGRRHAGEHRECLELGADARGMVLEQREVVIEQGEPVGPDDRTREDQPGQPGVTSQDCARLLGDVEQTGQPVAVGSGGAYSAPVASLMSSSSSSRVST